MSTIRISISLAVLALAALTLAAMPAAAKDGRDVRVSGVCTQSTTSKLKLSPEELKAMAAAARMGTSQPSAATGMRITL